MATGLTFDGREVDGLRLAFSGSDDATAEILHVGDEFTFVGKGKVVSVAHKENSFGVLRRVQSVSVDHAIPAPETVEAQIDLEIKRREDSSSGQESLDADIDAQSTDDG